MRVLVISDLHGDLTSAWAALEAVRPDVLLCCGDWGDPGEVTPEALAEFTERLPVYTLYGNHDDLDTLHAWRNRDGTPVLLPSGETVTLDGLTIAGISGIWAKSHRQPYYVTDEEVDALAARIAAAGPVDVLLSHGCPAGVADRTASGRHGGQRCFLRAFETIGPRVYLTGHLHHAQEYRTRDGRIVHNVGSTPAGEAVLLDYVAPVLEVTALRIPQPVRKP